jgi:KUP system potassium uptake protein
MAATATAPSRSRVERRPAVAAGLTLGALGVVFGDIGTSPLYAVQTVFGIDGGAVKPTQAGVYGIASLIFWALTLIVSVKYVLFILRAGNDGEGGVMALAALVRRAGVRLGFLVALGVFGASLFYGDSVITPAISVLSAVEGLKVSAPSIAHLVIPISLGILTALFAIQRRGTHSVGRLFGPVMVLWFAAIGLAGLREVAPHPEVAMALSPSYAADFVAADPGIAFVAMGAVVLAITGAEALYADMGHFGRAPIRRAWFGLVFPALTLNYLGQAAVILHHRNAIGNPFFLLLPHWERLPMVFLATVATVIASQAVISGAFSVSRQAVRLGFLPRLAVRHTSTSEVGQIYVPRINVALFAAVVALVIGFGSSAKLAAAYGIAVSGTFVITTTLFLTLARRRWRWPGWAIGLFAIVIGPVELAFFAANLSKVVHGGWLPLLIAAAVFTVMTTWHKGRQIVSADRARLEGSLREFVDRLRTLDPPVERVPGTAVFPNPSSHTTPLALRANVELQNVLHERVVIVSVETLDVPYVRRRDRVTVDDLGHTDDAILHVTARFGFQDEPNIPDALRLARARGVECDLDLESPSYFLSRITVVPSEAPSMRRWRKALFVALIRHAADPADYFGLPDDRTVEMGFPIPL